MDPSSNEWLSGNSERDFPLFESSIPKAFLLDVKVVPGSDPPIRGATRARITHLFYDLSEDEWTIYLDFPELELSDSVTIGREVSVGVGSELSWRRGFGTLCSVSVAPGADWDDPSASFIEAVVPVEWNYGMNYEYGDLVTRAYFPGVVYRAMQTHTSTTGEGTPPDPPGDGTDWEAYWSVYPWTAGEAGDYEFVLETPVEILRTRVECGPDRFIGFVLDGEDEWTPSFDPEVLVAGYNVNFSVVDGDIDLEVVPGGGEGLVPCGDSECSKDVLRISGISPSPTGEITLELNDCLRTEVAVVDDRIGLKIASDCLPCCNCSDYNAVSRAIARQSAKLGDIRDELAKAMETVELGYNSAVDDLNAQVPGLVTIHSVVARPSKISFYVQNNTLTNVYAVISIQLPPSSGASLVANADVMSGVQTESPPLVDLDPGGAGTGFTDPEDSDGWTTGVDSIVVTVGSGAFLPIPPKGKTLVSINFNDVETKLNTVAPFCSAMEVIFADPKSDTVHAWFDDDTTIITERNRISSLDGITVTPPDSWVGTAPDYITACSSVPPTGGVDCANAFAAISSLRAAAEIRVFARRAQIVFAEFDAGYTGSPIATAPEASEIADILAIPLNNDGADSIYYDQLDVLITTLTERAEQWLWDLVDGELAWQVVDPLEIVATAIYGEASFACKAFSASFETNPFANDDNEYLCMDGVISLFSEE